MRNYVEGDWNVTTPVFIGLAEDMAKAIQCKHKWISTESDKKNGVEMSVERCETCIATRAKWRKVEV